MNRLQNSLYKYYVYYLKYLACSTTSGLHDNSVCIANGEDGITEGDALAAGNAEHDANFV